MHVDRRKSDIDVTEYVAWHAERASANDQRRSPVSISIPQVKAPEMTKTIRGPRGPAGPTGERGQRRLRSARPERSTRHATKAMPTDRATLLAEVNGHIETFTRTRRADETDELRSSSRLMNFARR